MAREIVLRGSFPARNRAAGLCLVFASLLCTLTALAQQATPDLGDASLEELANIQVYSASKHLQLASEAPSSVTVITGDEIQRYGYRTLADILRSVRGFYVTFDRRYSYLGVRGFGRLGDWNNRILVLIDGHRINNAEYDQALLGDEFPLDIDLIERVEIARGPGSSLYGSNAFFAVINVISRKPSQVKGLELSFEPGSFDTYRGRATWSGRFQGVEMLLSGSVLSSGGQDLFFPEFNNPANNNGIAAAATDGNNSIRTLAVFNYRGLTAQVLFSTRDKHVPTGAFGNAFNDPRHQSVDNQEYLDLSYQRSLGEKWQLFARTAIDQTRLTSPNATPIPGGGIALNKFFSHSDWWTGEMRLSRTLLEKHKVTFGAEVRDNLREEQGFFVAPINTTFVSNTSNWIAAVYAQDEFSITSKLTLNAGLRHDRYYGVSGTTNPRLGLIYHPWTRTSLKMLYGTAFRAPNPSEMYAGISGFFVDNPQLSPETIRSFEAVVEQGLGQRFTLSGSVFQNRIKNLITVEFDSGSGLLINRNSQKAIATGVEVELAGKFVSGWQGAVSFTHVDSDDGGPADLELSNSPRQLAKLNLIVPLMRKWLFAGLEGQYTGPRHTLDGNTLGGFQVFNINLLGFVLDHHLDLSTGLYNVLDKRYSDPGRPEHVQDAIQQDGRNFRIKITGRF